MEVRNIYTVNKSNISLISIFIALNVIDAILTQLLLSWNGVEGAFWASSYNSNLLMKTLLPLLIGMILIYVGKRKLVKILNICMLFVVANNLFCVGIYLYGRYL